MGSVSPISRTSRSASSKLPSMATTFAPYMKACASLPKAILPAGSSTMQAMPGARGVGGGGGGGIAGAGADHGLATPASTALEIATVMPRSLKEPVGLSPSYLNRPRSRGRRAR